jgi:hypothetical protein
LQGGCWRNVGRLAEGLVIAGRLLEGWLWECGRGVGRLADSLVIAGGLLENWL